ncbi:exonuclease SbcCD subunit D C-terminal domain-containing protein [Moraxella sp. Tifton1]|uniref:exonuclease SbcCD subunit D C-terminal domain-containing protein n=1 Tax=Moraxella oculi TaxID=2940516 RepID=UPI0020125660|nr:exonuclease SbcCD subunit D C-terminal domain-containing protein [Moraxella sp. Tifton1]MCL1622689.1 exonuclease SbcCD subunit D C-terminal domain-containing protein [Moraxella sp. Tifton1]
MTATLKKPTHALRVLHTSDWHLGKRLYGQQRYDEFSEFLDWLVDAINHNDVDVLIVAGDVFDTMTPSNRAQELYYRFLGQVAKSCCRHVIITAGNHDSPTFLDAPKSILNALNIKVIGMVSHDIDDELLLLHHQNKPEAIVIAVPYLRDKDIRESSNFDDLKSKEHDTFMGIAKHYDTLSEHAKKLQQDIFEKFHKKIPIIATGHLFVAGSQISSKDDGMRDLYVGTLGQIPSGIFDPAIDYVALGHIHASQKVAKCEHIRYCGSPMAMGFGEVGKDKQVLIIDFEDTSPAVQSLCVPVFQQLIQISGDWQHINDALNELLKNNANAWVEIIYTGQELRPHLTDDIRQQLAGSCVLALNIQNRTLYQKSMDSQPKLLNLKQLSETDVFEQLLNQKSISEQERPLLKNAYQTLLANIHTHDHLEK